MYDRDLNGWVGERMRVGIIGPFVVPGENYYGRRVVDFFTERGSVWVTHISSTTVYICTLGWLGAKTEWA